MGRGGPRSSASPRSCPARQPACKTLRAAAAVARHQRARRGAATSCDRATAATEHCRAGNQPRTRQRRRHRRHWGGARHRPLRPALAVARHVPPPRAAAAPGAAWYAARLPALWFTLVLVPAAEPPPLARLTRRALELPVRSQRRRRKRRRGEWKGRRGRAARPPLAGAARLGAAVARSVHPCLLLCLRLPPAFSVRCGSTTSLAGRRRCRCHRCICRCLARASCPDRSE